MVKIEFQLRGDAVENVRTLADETLQQARQNFVEEALRRTLRQIIQENPVNTARSRAAWVNALEDIGGTPPAGWEGPHPSAIEAGRQQGTAAETESGNVSQASAVNHVSYVPELEYGSGRRAPVAMVRSALQQIAGQLAALFRW